MRPLPASAALCVALVFLAPLVLARPEERFMNLFPGLLLATVPIVLMVALPFVAAAVVVLRMLFPGYSYLDNVPFSLAGLVVIATLAMAHAQLRPLRVRDTASVALIASSAVNAALPWWPLD